MSTRQFVLLGCYVALLGVLLGRHIGLPLLRVFFVVFVGANRCVRPVVALLGRHIGLPLRFHRTCHIDRMGDISLWFCEIPHCVSG